MNVPQSISIVDAGGHLLAFARMDGAFAMSMPTSLMKTKTAASCGEPTDSVLAGVNIKPAIATQRINLPVGLPVIIRDRVVGAIGEGLRRRRAGPRGCHRRAENRPPALGSSTAAAHWGRQAQTFDSGERTT